MSRIRKLMVLLAWLFPLLFAAVVRLIPYLGLFSEEVLIASFLVGPLGFAVMLSHLLFVREEDREVRYARASRRLGYMCKLSAFGVLAAGFASMHFVRAGAEGFLPEHVLILTVFLIASAIVFAFAAIIFRIVQIGSIEVGGARDSIVVVIVMLLVAAFVFPALTRSRTNGHRENCQNNLKQIGLVCKMFGNENGGIHPELSSRPGYLSMANIGQGYKSPIYPEYFFDLRLLTCPQSAGWDPAKPAPAVVQEAFDASSYAYLGYVTRNSDEFETFFECYQERVAAGLPFDKDLPAPPGRGSGGGDKMLRLREGVEDVYRESLQEYTDERVARAVAQAEIPVMIECLGNHEKAGGINVLYMDGHVEFLKYPGEWPATPRTFSIINAIESMRPTAPPVPEPE